LYICARACVCVHTCL